MGLYDDYFGDYLAHYGTPRHSGRYPWGSGETPYQRDCSFMGRYKDLKSQGLSESKIAESMGISTTKLRARISESSTNIRRYNQEMAVRMKDHGYSNTAIGKKFGVRESTVRSWLDEDRQKRATALEATKSVLKDNLKKNQAIDIGDGTEIHMGITKTKLSVAVAALEDEGYNVYTVKVPQLGTDHLTTLKVLANPDVTWKDINDNKEMIKIGTINEHSSDFGETYWHPQYPKSLDLNRVKIRYSEEGGTDMDGVIQLRRGVDDVSLGNSNFAQVRIAVDDKYYLKGMAVYGEDKDFPPGVDVIFNSNKSQNQPLSKVLKEMKNDPDNPFGATISAQVEYKDKDGNTTIGVVNKVNEQGDWEKWGKKIASQMLSKQPVVVAKTQLDVSYQTKLAEFEQLKNLQNPEVKAKLLETFANKCDSDAVDLKAAAFPRQSTNVLLPVNSLAPNEVYAPRYQNGEQVVCIRYPHAGRFEIPLLTVNNDNQEAKNMIGNASDAIGINHKVAATLSGADFDGDTVVTIPVSQGIGSQIRINTSSKYDELKNFDPKEAYPYHEGMTIMNKHSKQVQMGVVSNLITDMTLGGATDDDIIKAVKHSMVVIDSEKHKLDYKQSEIDNDITALKKKYQTGGASTLISRAKGEERVAYRRDDGKIDPETGKKIYTYTDRNGNPLGEFTDKNGITKTKMTKSTHMAETDDAYKLTSGGTKENPGNRMEGVYAEYANNMKALGNQARLELLRTEPTRKDPEAAKEYADEVKSLKSKLQNALSNAPLERQAQIVGNSIYKEKLKANPDMSDDEKKRSRGQALNAGRARVGARKQQVEITEPEWKAIQAHALSSSTIKQILDNTDLDKVKAYATPRDSKNKVTASTQSRIKSLESRGYTLAEIAKLTGVSTTSVSNVLNG